MLDKILLISYFVCCLTLFILGYIIGINEPEAQFYIIVVLISAIILTFGKVLADARNRAIDKRFKRTVFPSDPKSEIEDYKIRMKNRMRKNEQ